MFFLAARLRSHKKLHIPTDLAGIEQMQKGQKPFILR
jgi:hypothetical protein